MTDNFLPRWIQKGLYIGTLYELKKGDYVHKWRTFNLPQIVVHEVISEFTLLFDSTSYIKQWKCPTESDVITHLSHSHKLLQAAILVLSLLSWQ